MTLRHLLRRALTQPLRVVPAAVRRRAAQLVAASFAEGDPRNGMRWLLQVDADVTALQNEVALTYDSGVHVKHRLMRYHDFFVDRIARDEAVLDIGCGYGAVAYSIASRAEANVTGIDLDARNIASARSRFLHPRLSFVHGDALQALPQGRPETIVLSNVLEHVEDRVGFLRAVEERAHPRRWLIRVPMFDRDWRVPLRKELGLDHRSDPTHFTEYTRDTFENEMREAGLRIVHLQVNWGEIWAEVQRNGD